MTRPRHTFRGEEMERHSFVYTTDGTRLAVSESGPADAPLHIVFAHGMALSQHIWRPQWRSLTNHLGDRAHLVFYDQRGHGNSQESCSGPDGYCIAQVGADLATVIDHTCLSGPIMAVGHSLGGMSILSLAHHHPDIAARLTGAALISTAAHSLSDMGIGRALHTPAVPLLEHVVNLAPAITHYVWNLARAAVGPMLGIPVMRTLSRDDGASIRAVIGILNALRVHDETAGLPLLNRLPDCLVACGEADPVTPLQHSLNLCAHLPNARLLTAAGAGHMLPLERPRLINDALVEMAAGLVAVCLKSPTLVPA